MTAAFNRRPLVVRFGALGDMVLLTPLLARLAERYGAPCDLISSGPWTASLLEGLPFVGETTVLRSRRTPYGLSLEQRALVHALRAREPGPVYLCEHRLDKVDWLLERAGIAERWLSRLKDVPRAGDEHFVDRFARFAETTPRALSSEQGLNASVCAPARPPVPTLAVTDDEAAECRQFIDRAGWGEDPLVLLQPGNKRTMRRFGSRRRATNSKYWPESRWGEVGRGVLSALPNARVLVCGTPAEAELATDVVRAVDHPRAESIADRLPLRRLLALLGAAHSMISVDTGPAHAAAALELPLVVLFGRADPRLYAPRSNGSPVHVLSGAVGAVRGASDPVGPEAWASSHDIAAIEPAAVLAAWRSEVR